MPRARVGSTPSGVSSTASRLEAGSVLTSSTRLPRSASATALAPATEVLPTPLLPVNSRWRGGVTRKGKVYRRLSSCGHPGFLDRSDDDSATRRHPRIGRRRPAHRRRRRPRGHGPCRAPTRRSPEAPAGWRRSGAPSWYGRRRSLPHARDADRDCQNLGIERLRRRRRGRQAWPKGSTSLATRSASNALSGRSPRSRTVTSASARAARSATRRRRSRRR